MYETVWIDTNATAARLGITRRTLYAWLSSGRPLPVHRRVGDRWQFDAASVATFDSREAPCS